MKIKYFPFVICIFCFRDEFDSMEEFCNYYDISVEDVMEKLNSLNMKYHKDINQIKML